MLSFPLRVDRNAPVSNVGQRTRHHGDGLTIRTLVLGGARSGKSAYAEALLPATEPVTYVATARRNREDEEWEARIAAHIARRPSAWTTVETPNAASLPDLLSAARAVDPPLLVDDLATWVTGVLDEVSGWDGDAHRLARADEHTAELVTAVARCSARLVLVSAEVGLGVVPATRSGRLMRDWLGSLNARLAVVCDEVLLLVAGIPITLKSGGGGT